MFAGDDDQRQDDDCFILSAEESALAELLGELQHGDFARILNQLSPHAKNELRSAIGFFAEQGL